ncbi:hypothetical protein QTP86_024427, partial [Hemibagrus guttatus]
SLQWQIHPLSQQLSWSKCHTATCSIIRV